MTLAELIAALVRLPDSVPSTAEVVCQDPGDPAAGIPEGTYVPTRVSYTLETPISGRANLVVIRMTA